MRAGQAWGERERPAAIGRVVGTYIVTVMTARWGCGYPVPGVPARGDVYLPYDPPM